MEYKEKFRIARDLHRPDHLEKDLELLATVEPSSALISKPVTEANRPTRAEEVIWALLDHVTAERIIANRMDGNTPLVNVSQAKAPKQQATLKKKSPRKRSILISRGLAFISKTFKGRTSSTTIVFTHISRWLRSIRSWINDHLKKI